MSDLFFGPMDPMTTRKDTVAKIASMPSNYVGSKRRMLEHIWKMLDDNEIKFDSVFDAFSGGGMVSLMFKWMGKSVVANDLLTSSAITAICLLENESVPLTAQDIHFLCTNQPKDYGTFVLDNFKDKFFTEKECYFLDKFRRNIELLCGPKFYCGLDLLGKATLASIPNSNFSVYGKDLKSLRSVHEEGKPFWKEKWRDTTRKRRDSENNIMFEQAIEEMREKYRSAFSLLAIEQHVTQNCFLGGRYYNGQTLAKLEHRLNHQKNQGIELEDKPVLIRNLQNFLTKGSNCCVFNSDIIDLLEANIVQTDIIYLDPPYGGASSDYSNLYRFLEEFIYEKKLEDLEHIQKGAKRYTKAKGYQEQFEHLLALCSNFPIWLLSYNDSSYADLETIKSTIRNAGKSNIIVNEIPYTYQYRKGKSDVDIAQFTKQYAENGHEFTQRGQEYLILATG